MLLFNESPGVNRVNPYVLCAAVARCVPQWFRCSGVFRPSSASATAAAGRAADGESSVQTLSPMVSHMEQTHIGFSWVVLCMSSA